jgi:tetratricopeptide (TPR) repeat protein
MSIRLSRHPSLSLALGALTLLPLSTRAARAQDGPSATISDEAESNANPDAPTALNTVQQARLKLSDGNRSTAQAEKLEAKAAAASDAAKKEELHGKAKKAYEAAIADYQTAIKLDPKLAEAYVGLAEMMIKSGKIDQAIQTTEKALEIDPQSVHALITKGKAQLAGFKVPDAKATYDRLAAESAKEAKSFLAVMRTWLEAQRARLGPEMKAAVDELDAWIKERESK